MNRRPFEKLTTRARNLLEQFGAWDWRTNTHYPERLARFTALEALRTEGVGEGIFRELTEYLNAYGLAWRGPGEPQAAEGRPAVVEPVTLVHLELACERLQMRHYRLCRAGDILARRGLNQAATRYFDMAGGVQHARSVLRALTAPYRRGAKLPPST